MIDRELFIKDLCALAEQGIKFLHQGRSPETGMDCIFVPRFALEKQGIQVPEELAKEFESYHSRPDGFYLLSVMRKWLNEIDPQDAVPGDLLVLYARRNPQHLAALVSENEVVEAYRSDGMGIAKVLKQPLDPRRRIAAAFRIPDFET